MADNPKAFFQRLFHVAIRAADPAVCLPPHLPPRPKGRTVVVGAGKGAAQLAQVLENVWDGPLEGAIVTRRGFGAATKRIEVIEASHPVPDEAGNRGARRLLELVQGLPRDDLVIALITGGGSALLPAPAGGLTLEDEIRINEVLLTSGAPISAMNTVRKHVSAIKGGRLALAAHPARVVTLVVSDIPGDDPGLVSSGPTVPTASTRQDALAIIDRYRLKLPQAALDHLHSPAADAPRPDDPRLAGNEVKVIASARLSLEAAAGWAEAQGIRTAILSDAIEGEARDVGLVHGAIAREIALRDQPFARPVLLLSGGETTVTLGHGETGKGGRNGEFLLSFAIAVAEMKGIEGFAADTDGIDGSETNAGAFADFTTVRRLAEHGLDAKALLASHDSWTAFNALGDLFTPGPTGTNVNDFRAILVK